MNSITISKDNSMSPADRSQRKVKSEAWVAKAAKQPLLRETVDLGPLGAEDVEVAVEHCGLCHSDLSVLNNDWGISQYPAILGHVVWLRPQVRMPRVSRSDSASASDGTRAATCTVTSVYRETITFARKSNRPSSAIAADSRPTSARTGLGYSRYRKS